MSAEFDALTAEVAAETTVEQSAITLLDGLTAEIKALGGSPTPQQLTDLTAKIEASRAALAAAILANTPAAPTA